MDHIIIDGWVVEKISQYDYTEKRENKNKFMHALYKKKTESPRDLSNSNQDEMMLTIKKKN